jgi:hypothetical protein
MAGRMGTFSIVATGLVIAATSHGCATATGRWGMRRAPSISTIPRVNPSSGKSTSDSLR